MHHLDIGHMAEQHAMRVQRAFRVTRGARGVDDDRWIVRRCIDSRNSSDASSIAAQNDFAPAWIAPDVT